MSEPESTPRDRAVLTLRLPRPLHSYLTAIANEQETTLTTLITVLLATATDYDGLQAPTAEKSRKVAEEVWEYAEKQDSKGPMVA